MGLLQLCEKYFNTTNIYDILGITETATDKEVKKAYHRLSLKVHPDRVEENEKLEATEKFKVLGNIHAILTDKDKRAVYDETKNVDDDDDFDILGRDWMSYWRSLFKKITLEDIKAYEKEYAGSALEKEDLKKAYLAGKGDMDYITDQIQFARSENEPRLKEILNQMIKEGEIPAYKAFTHETEKKRQRRHAKEIQEEEEADEEAKRLGLEPNDENSLELMIKERQEARSQQFSSFLDRLGARCTARKAKATKRKETQNAETTSKRKRRK